MSLKETLLQDQIQAMKNKESDRLTTLRMVLAAIKNTEIDSKEELDDEKIQGIIATQVKQLKDALKDFETGGRSDLIEKTKTEISLLETYLPEQMSDEELKTIVSETLSQVGASSPADLGKVMGAVMGKVKGKADGNRVRSIAMELLN